MRRIGLACNAKGEPLEAGRFRHRVALDHAVAQMHAAACVARDVRLVGDENDSVALLIETFEQHHDLLTGFGIEVAGWLVGQDDRRIVHQRAGNCDALALSAGEFVRLMCIRSPSPTSCQRLRGPFSPVSGSMPA